MKYKKLTSIVCLLVICASACLPSFAETAPYALPVPAAMDNAPKAMHFTVETAVRYGLENNPAIKMLDNKIELAFIASKNARKNVDDLKEAKEKLEDAADYLDEMQGQWSDSQSQVNTAVEMLDLGVTPVPTPFVNAGGDPVLDGSGNPIVFPAGTHLKTAIAALGFDDATAAAIADAHLAGVRSVINANQDALDEKKVALIEANQLLFDKENEFDAVLKDTSEKIDAKIGYNSIVELDADDAGDLMITMAGVNLDITKYAKRIYRNQIAMLIQKNYYDALYAEKVLKLKHMAKTRGEKQYTVVKLSYDNGMKSKEDLLLSKMYFDSTVIACRLAEANYNNSLFELKKNLHVDMACVITLEDSMSTAVTKEDFNKGLKSGLTNRIEIQKNLGSLMIYELNEKILRSMYSGNKRTNAYAEAILLRDGAALELERTKMIISAEVSQSYEQMCAAGEMLKASAELVQSAEEVVRIAQLKYDQGLGFSSALLADLNLQESTGTIIELIAAQEKLADVEAQVANITYGYTMSKVKYFCDSAQLVY